MKLILFTLLISLVSTPPSDNFSFNENSTSTQTRAANYIYSLQSKLFELNEDPDFVINNILPEVYAQRDILAPHYPSRNSSNSDPMIELIDQWIADHPQEHKDYRSYLENYIRTYPE